MATEHAEPMAKDRLFVVAVSASPAFLDAVAAGLADLSAGLGRTLRGERNGTCDINGIGPPQYADAVRRARRYLDRVLPCADIDLICGETLGAARERLLVGVERGEGARCALALVLVDAATADVTV